jgi:hypothetical protein
VSSRPPRTSSDLDALVEDNAEEGSHLEFKSARALENEGWNRFKAELPKDVSAFANAGGGVIVIGVEENDSPVAPVAERVAGSAKRVRRLADLENVVLSGVVPVIAGIEFRTISHESGEVYVIDVPMSLAAPHQASDGKFYARRKFRRDHLELFEIETLLHRRSQQDDQVFGGIVVEGGQLHAVVENNRDFPIFDVKLIAPNSVISMFQRSERAPLLGRGIGVLGGRQSVSVFLESAIVLFNKKNFPSVFDYRFEYKIHAEGKLRSVDSKFSLSDLAGTRLLETDVARMETVIKKGFENLSDRITEGSKSLVRELECLSDPTGLAVSFSTLERLRDVFELKDDYRVKWKPEWMNSIAFQELFGVSEEIGNKLYGLFLSVRYGDDENKEKRLDQYDWISPELQTQMEARLRLPPWIVRK